MAEEVEKDVAEKMKEFQQNQQLFVQQFETKNEHYQCIIDSLRQIKTSLETNKLKLQFISTQLQKDVQKRIDACRDLNPLDIGFDYVVQLTFMEKDSILEEIYIWIFGVIYRIPTKNIDIKKQIAARIKAEEGKEFILKLATYQVSELRVQEKEATILLLEKQSEYLAEDMKMEKKMQLIQLFNIISMYLEEKQTIDDINTLKTQIFKEKEDLDRLECNEKFQSIEIQTAKAEQESYKIIQHALATIKHKIKFLN